MILPRNLFLLYVVHWLLSYARSDLRIQRDQFEIMTEKTTKMIANCERQSMNRMGVLRSSKTVIKWAPEFVARTSFINLKDSQETDEQQTQLYDSWNILEDPWREKLHTFMIIAASKNNFEHLIRSLKRTTWWNPLARFLVLNSGTVETGCKEAFPFLWSAWLEDILSVTYICVDPVKGYTMYTYNPFTKDAPKHWKEIFTNHMNRKNHTWTLLRRRFAFEHVDCKDFFFEKTANLGGYPLKTIGLELQPILSINNSRTGLKRFAGIDGYILRLLWGKLNATLDVTATTNTSSNYIYLTKIMSGEYDVLLNSQFIFNKPHLTTAYPHMHSGISVLARRPSYETGYARILRFMNPKLMTGLLLVYAGTVLTLKLFAGEGTIWAMLEVLRIALGVSTLRSPRRNPMRIYLSTVMILYMLTASLFQSNLSSLLTSPVMRPLVDDRESLKESMYKIYTFRAYWNAVIDEELHTRVRILDHWECSKYVLENENAVCAADRSILMKIAFEKKLHVSNHRIAMLYSAFAVRPNLPMLSMISQTLMQIVQSGLVEYIVNRTSAYYLDKWRMMQKEMRIGRKHFRSMELEDLSFAFYVLLIGIGLSFVVFLLEIGLARIPRPLRTKRAAPVFPFTL